MSALTRIANSAKLSLTTSLATTPAIDMSSHSGGTVHIPAGSSITSLTWHSGYNATEPRQSPQAVADLTFLPLSDATLTGGTTTAVVQTVEAGKAYDLPSALFGCRAVKIVADAAGDVYLNLKG